MKDNWFDSLPDEIILEIFLNLNFRQLIIISSISKKFFWISRDNLIWKIIYEKTFVCGLFKVTENLPLVPTIDFHRGVKLTYLNELENLNNCSERKTFRRIIAALNNDAEAFNDNEIYFHELFYSYEPTHYPLIMIAAATNNQSVMDCIYKICQQVFKYEKPEKLIEGVSLIHLAILLNQNLETLRNLINENNINRRSAFRFNNYTPLHFAAHFNRCSLMNFLIEAGAVLWSKTSQLSQQKSLTAHSIKPEIVCRHMKIFKYDIWHKVTPLHVAIIHGHINIVKLITNNPAGIHDYRDNYSEPPLVLAVKTKNLPITKLLLEHEVFIDAKNLEGENALHAATSMGLSEIATTLVPYFKKSINEYTNDKHSALHFAVRNKKLLNIVKQLLENGADINIPNYSGQTALHVTCSRGITSIAKLLMEKGADLNVRDNNGFYPIQIAVKSFAYKIVSSLITFGANLNQPDKQGETPLHQAVRCDDTEMVKLLLQNGANASFLNEFHQTPFDIALYDKSWGIVKIILQYDPSLNVFVVPVVNHSEISLLLSIRQYISRIRTTQKYGSLSVSLIEEAKVLEEILLGLKVDKIPIKKYIWSWGELQKIYRKARYFNPALFENIKPIFPPSSYVFFPRSKSMENVRSIYLQKSHKLNSENRFSSRVHYQRSNSGLAAR